MEDLKSTLSQTTDYLFDCPVLDETTLITIWKFSPNYESSANNLTVIQTGKFSCQNLDRCGARIQVPNSETMLVNESICPAYERLNRREFNWLNSLKAPDKTFGE